MCLGSGGHVLVMNPDRSSKSRPNLYALTWHLQIIFWQLIFFVGPVLFMAAMSFFLVKNYRMTEAFEFVN